MSDEHPQEPGSDEFGEDGAPEESASPPDEAGSSSPVTQSELDEAFASQAPDPEPSHTLANLPECEAPLIEKELITDPAILDVLLRPEDLSGAARAADADPKDSESLLMEQQEIDAILARQGSDPSDRIVLAELLEADPPVIEKIPITDPEILSTLMGDSIESSPDESAETESQGVPESASGSLLSQEDLDALIAASQEAPQHTMEELLEGDELEIEREEITDPKILSILMGTDADDTDSSDAVADEQNNQSSIDELVAAELEGEAEPGAGDPADLGAIDQSSIDALLSDSVAAGPSTDQGAVDQSEIDALLSGSGASESSGEEEPLSGQAEIDALTAELNAANDSSDHEITDSDSTQEANPNEDMDSPIEDELASIADGDTESVLAGGEVEEVLDATDMDDLLDTTGDANIEVVTKGDDDPLAALVGEAEKPGEAVGGENIAAAGSTEPDSAGEALPQGLLDQLVQDAQEGAAGPGGGEETAPALEEEAVEALEVEAKDIEEEVAPVEVEEGAGVRKSPISFSFGEEAASNPTKAVSAMAAGVVIMLAAFTYLYTHRFQDPENAIGTISGETYDLARAMARARQLMDKRAYGEAVTVLDDAIAKAPISSEKTDAQFLRIEAAFHGLPLQPSPAQADRLHAEIDRLVEFARAHPQAPEALFWKAKLYERGENPIAARSEFRGILDGFGNAANIDRVLYALGELELRTERPVQAIDFLQRIAQEFPSSPLAPMARLLTGDAFAAAGDADGARLVYIRSAQSHPEDSIGAEAFERLGRLAFDSGDYKAAIRELEARIESATTVEGMDNVYLLFSRSLRANGEYARARDVLNELIDFFPESNVTPLAYVELSKTMNDLGMTDDAVRLATETVERYPDNSTVLRNAGELLTISGDAQSAARALMAAVGAGAKEPSLLLAAGRQFYKADDLVAAKDALEQLAIAHPTSREALEGSIEWARIAYAMGRPTMALERLEDLALSTADRPQRLLVLTAMGEMYLDLGMETAATDSLSRVVSMASNAETLANASIALLNINASGAVDLGLAAAARVDVSRVLDTTAYAFLMKFGEAQLRGNSRKGLEAMEQAHAAYPQERTIEGVQRLLRANLTTKRAARARAIVTELQTQAARDPLTRPQLESAATLWGDFLFARGDYRAAADAYALGMGPPVLDGEGAAPVVTLSENNWWNMYQRASALFRLASFGESITLYDRVATSGASFAGEATSRASVVRLEQRLRGLPVTPGAGTS